MRRFLIGIMALMLSHFCFAQMNQANQYDEFERHCHVSQSGDTLRYRFLRPENMKKNKKYPLVVFLHGAGERGSDNQKQLVHGGQMWLNPVNRENHPCFVLAPQCPEGRRWSDVSRYSSQDKGEGLSSMMEPLKDLITECIAMPGVDPDRVYISGLSMGGVGTFDMCVTYPELFAAAIPICGSVRPELLKNAKKIKFRIYHGDKDFVVPFEGSRKAYRKLKRLGADVTYIERAGVNHGVWNDAFNDPEYLNWMFRQHK